MLLATSSVPKPIGVACRRCAAQPRQDCEEWSSSQGGMVAIADLVHPERIEDAAYWDGDRTVAPVSHESFTDAVEASGLI